MSTRPPKPRHPGRRRTFAGLTLLTCGLTAAAACAASAYWWVGYCSDTWLADFGDGTLYTQRIAPGPFSGGATGWNVSPNGANGRSWSWRWWAFGETTLNWNKVQAHSVWPIAPLLLGTGGSLVFFGARARTRYRQDRCLACGYSRQGLPAATPCPECGVPSPATT